MRKWKTVPTHLDCLLHSLQDALFLPSYQQTTNHSLGLETLTILSVDQKQSRIDHSLGLETMTEINHSLKLKTITQR